MDQVVKAKVTKDANNKRKWEDEQGGNPYQQQTKRRKLVRAYATGSCDRKGYVGTLPLYDRCNLHHHLSPCPAQCGKCKKVGHQARDCRTPTSVTCYECGEQGHTRKYCPDLENQLGVGEACQDPNIATGTFLLKNRYIFVLTNTSANRSFIFTVISPLSDVASTFSVTKRLFKKANDEP
ncbi:reverse transcriptase domain-containing protein [Tanacetum coccineum]